MILYKNGLVLLGKKLVNTSIVANRGKIVEIAPDIVADSQTEVVDCTGKFILPAFVDLHVHGGGGYDFNTANLEQMGKIVEFHANHGVGTLFPTLVADSDENLSRQLQLIAELAKEYPEVKGINLEGPFLSKQKCGAIAPQFLQNPSMEKFLHYQQCAKGMIKIVTVAPELPNAISLTEELSANGVIVSLGHSNAPASVVEKALEAGAKCFTHWGNAMSQMDRLDVGVMGSALVDDGCFVEVICDGHHVSKQAVQLLVKAKGSNKVVGISDSIMATGLADGNYKLAGQDVVVQGGQAFLTDGKTRAGSTLTLDVALANLVTFCKLPLAEAIAMLTTTPAKLVGLSHRIGTIEIGKDADFTIMGGVA